MFITAEEAARRELAYIKGRRSGDIKSLSTGWSKFDSVHMDGLEFGWIVLVGGISGSGKTALLSMMETAFFDHNDLDISVLSFTFEMSARRLAGRKISSKLRKSVKQLYSADMYNNVNDADLSIIETDIIPEISKYDISYMETPSSVPEMSLMIDEFVLQHPDKQGYVFTLDHTLLAKSSGGSERATLGEIGALFNEKRKQYPNSIYIIISQLNRDIESSSRRESFTGHYPVRSDIFGADALYHIADAVIVIHRPELLNIGAYGPDKMRVDNRIYCHHIKVRDGEPCITIFENKLYNNQLIEI